MKQAFYHLFETPLGWCGIAWNDKTPPEVIMFQLPEASKKLTEERIWQRLEICAPAAPPPEITKAVKRICRHLSGEPQDFQDIPVDFSSAGAFARKVYETARKIPSGKTLSYGELAKAVGRPGAARAVGNALGKNPVALLIPCHRILASGGKPGGFSAPGGNTTKAKMLAMEGIRLG